MSQKYLVKKQDLKPKRKNNYSFKKYENILQKPRVFILLNGEQNNSRQFDKK